MPASHRRSAAAHRPRRRFLAVTAGLAAALAVSTAVVVVQRVGLPVHERTTSHASAPGPVAVAASAGSQAANVTAIDGPLPEGHPKEPPDGLTLGTTGPAVLALQQRLVGLGYWIGTPDGVFGDSTEQAVYAYQKAAGVGADGVVGPRTQAALAQGVVPTPRSTSGYVIEVNLERELLLVVQDGKIREILNTSTGGGYTYTSDGITAVAQTPTGQFQIYRQVDGMVTDSLGQLWRPKFFTGGFAIHGDSYVPPGPVSHGCVRVSNEAIDWIWANNVLPMGTSVLVY